MLHPVAKAMKLTKELPQKLNLRRYLTKNLNCTCGKLLILHSKSMAQCFLTRWFLYQSNKKALFYSKTEQANLALANHCGNADFKSSLQTKTFFPVKLIFTKLAIQIAYLFGLWCCDITLSTATLKNVYQLKLVIIHYQRIHKQHSPAVLVTTRKHLANKEY